MLVANHGFYLHHAGQIESYPFWVQRQFAYEMAHFDGILWVEHPVNRIWWPWLVNMEWARELVLLIDRGIDKMPIEKRMTAEAHGLLFDPAKAQHDRLVFEMAKAHSRSSLSAWGYTVLPSITFPHYTNCIDFYFASEKAKLVGDNQVQGRQGRHNLPLFTFLHEAIANLVQSISEQPLKPSYCYAVKYEQGAVLKKHTDRPQCKWNASITFSREGAIWPIYLEVEGHEVEINAKIGEVVVYSGTTIPHWRNALPDPSATVCFYHFVDQDYQGDRR